MGFLRNALMGAAAGAAGTVALNATTYADMVARARPSSSVPSEVAGELAGKAGIDLSGSDGDASAQNRKTGLGALLGILTGVGVGTAYGIIRPHMRSVSTPRAAVVLCLAAMAGSDGPATALGITDPTQWGASSWASDIVPHLAYGLVTVAAYEAFGRS